MMNRSSLSTLTTPASNGTTTTPAATNGVPTVPEPSIQREMRLRLRELEALAHERWGQVQQLERDLQQMRTRAERAERVLASVAGHLAEVSGILAAA